VNDDSSPNVYVLLVPDEGFSGIVKLHDRLYTGLLADRLRLDIPFIPHVTIGYSTDIHLCKSAVDDLNGQDFEIEGVIDQLELVRIEGSTYETIYHFQLGATTNPDI
jgi:2'-5' RNA ligase